MYRQAGPDGPEEGLTALPDFRDLENPEAYPYEDKEESAARMAAERDLF